MRGTDDTHVGRLIREAIDEMNAARTARPAIPTMPETVLVGDGGVLDSLGFVTLAVTVEKKIEHAFCAQISVVEIVVAGDERWTIGALADAIAREVSDVGAPR